MHILRFFAYFKHISHLFKQILGIFAYFWAFSKIRALFLKNLLNFSKKGHGFWGSVCVFWKKVKVFWKIFYVLKAFRIFENFQCFLTKRSWFFWEKLVLFPKKVMDFENFQCFFDKKVMVFGKNLYFFQKRPWILKNFGIFKCIFGHFFLHMYGHISWFFPPYISLL